MFKYWLISIGYFFGVFFMMTFLMTIFNYFNIISSEFVSVLKFIIPIISIAISGYIMGSHSKEKGYLSGIEIGVSIILVFLLFVVLFDKVTIKSLIYYVILILVSILSSMIGINIKKK